MTARQIATVYAVEIDRAEGPPDHCGKMQFRTIADAQAWIDAHEYSYPDLGYDKHAITLWTAKGTYQMRLDCVGTLNRFWEPRANSILKHFHDCFWATMTQARNN